MSDEIKGDGRTFVGHVIRGNFEQIFHHDIPKVIGITAREAKVLQDGWNKLSPELQTAMVHASGIMSEIASDVNKVPSEVVNGILSKFTDVKVEDLQQWLAKVQGVFTGAEAANDQDLNTTVQNIQSYLQQNAGEKLDGIISTIAQIIASIISPDTVFAKIATYMEIAYRTFVKK